MVAGFLVSRNDSKASLLLASKKNCFRNSSRKRACAHRAGPATQTGGFGFGQQREKSFNT